MWHTHGTYIWHIQLNMVHCVRQTPLCVKCWQHYKAQENMRHNIFGEHKIRDTGNIWHTHNMMFGRHHVWHTQYMTHKICDIRNTCVRHHVCRVLGAAWKAQYIAWLFCVGVCIVRLWEHLMMMMISRALIMMRIVLMMMIMMMVMCYWSDQKGLVFCKASTRLLCAC